MPELAQNFLKKNKNKEIEFHFHSGVTSDIIQGLKEKKYDIGLCSKLEQEPGIEYVPLLSKIW